MHILYSSLHNIHQPPYEIFNGEREMHQEVPARVERILQALAATQHVLTDIKPNEQQRQQLLQVLKQIHTNEYVHYLQSTDFGEGYVYPSVFSYRYTDGSSTHPVAKRGFYSFDTYTPLSSSTFEAALNSAYLAQSAARELMHSSEVQYVLCRPPGHHAEPSRMGGYCYFNNGGVAAQTLKNADPLHRIAILDVDFHHGNGAEQIFASREDILTISIHADPNEKFPFFSGQETTAFVSNTNFPLPLGTTNRQYQQTLTQALERIRAHRTTHLVVCFGADTHVDDPIGGFLLTTGFFTKMARQIRTLNLPTVIVQEGGYNTDALGKNVVAFLEGFE